jgi:hypothetical protein
LLFLERFMGGSQKGEMMAPSDEDTVT